MDESARHAAVSRFGLEAGRPVVPQPHLRRARLHGLLEAGATHPVTVLRAGAGWGKTTLVAAWAAEQPRPDRVAWLTVRRRHTGVAALCSGIAAAMGLSPVDMPAGDEAAVRTLLDRLASVFDRRNASSALILDDLHLLTGTSTERALATLVAHLPAGLRLVLLCRNQPALPDAGRLITIGVEELALHAAEAADLVGLLGGGDPSIGEGWPLGVRLAAESDDPRAIDDYLWREVVDPLPAPIRRFLLRTSVVEQLTPALAETLTGIGDSEHTLGALARDTGLVTSDDDADRYFRYHGQLRAMLRRRLESEAPGLVARLHVTAAHWYAAERSVPEALRHAADAADWAYLGRLVAELAVTRIVSAERRLVVDAVQRVPPQFLPTTPELALCAALLAFVAGDFAAVPSWIGRSRAMLAGRDTADRLAVDAALGLLEIGTVHRVHGDMPNLVEAATEVLGRLSTADTGRLPLLLQLRAVATNNKGVGLLWSGRLEQAERHLWSALRAARTTGLELIDLNASGHLALLAYFQGDLGLAETHAGSAQQLAEQHGLSATAQAMAGQLALALIEVERDRITEARDHWRRTLRTEANPPEAALIVMSSVVLVHLLLATEDVGSARLYLRQARQEDVYALNAPFLQRWINLVESGLDVAHGLPAQVVARYRDRTALMMAEQAVLGQALIAAGDSSGEQLLAAAANGPDRIAAVQAWISLALLADAQGKTSRAAAAAARAAALAEPDGIRRPLRRLRLAGIDPASGQRPPAPGAALPEPLSSRETEVLQFLPSVLTAQEIADHLGVSVTTIKAHLRSIYRKLGAARRREAVDIAHRLGLL
ncbi:LuxR C-terminal-related transcriptional regulator [Actinoplanes sp. NBC_00393]|uniref:LuxR C-terminal-related transcriptional regulator n=1 Tax=Actinoplanes sp. NBC_00393 TaxID=2975953 RepID=UPI002E23E682